MSRILSRQFVSHRGGGSDAVHVHYPPARTSTHAPAVRRRHRERRSPARLSTSRSPRVSWPRRTPWRLRASSSRRARRGPVDGCRRAACRCLVSRRQPRRTPSQSGALVVAPRYVVALHVVRVAPYHFAQPHVCLPAACEPRIRAVRRLSDPLPRISTGIRTPTRIPIRRIRIRRRRMPTPAAGECVSVSAAAREVRIRRPRRRAIRPTDIRRTRTGVERAEQRQRAAGNGGRRRQLPRSRRKTPTSTSTARAPDACRTTVRRRRR